MLLRKTDSMQIRLMTTSDLVKVAIIDAHSFGKVFNLDSTEISLNIRTKRSYQLF